MGNRIMLFLWVAVMLGGSGRVQAEPVRIVDGGPRAKKQRAALQASLESAARLLGVCWQGERPKTVEIDLAVAADGRVTSSKQTTQGAVAQCAAGVLAVQTLAATGSGYRARAAFATSSAKGDTIQAALAPVRGQLDDCHKQANTPKSGGQVVLRFLIHPDGRLADAQVQSSALAEPKVERSLVATINRTRIAAGVTDKAVSYSLTLNFAGAGQDAAPAAAALQPKKDGPMDGSAISAVMDRRKADFSACYTAKARKNRSLAGHVVLRFTIRDDGTPRNVKIKETTLNNADVERCIVKVGESLRFPAERGRQPTKVWYPFAFSTH